MNDFIESVLIAANILAMVIVFMWSARYLQRVVWEREDWILNGVQWIVFVILLMIFLSYVNG